MTRRIIAVVGVLGLVTACGHESPLPGPTTPGPTIVTLTISSGVFSFSSPSLMQPGESRQFSATVSLSDKTSRDVTGTATWRTSNPSVFSLTGGLVTAMTAGEGSITVNYEGRSAGLYIVSLPSGTGVLVGTVKEASFPIAGTTIAVVGGPMAGRSAVSDGSGSYRLYGVVGDLQIRASRDGYVALTKPVTVTPFSTPRRDQTLDFDLNPASRVLALAGSYRVSLRASSTCAGKLPADITVREYAGTMTQDGSRLTIVLSGAEFAVDSTGVTSNRFGGRAKADSVELALGRFSFYYYYYYGYFSWGFIERLTRPQIGAWGFSQTTYLSVIGTAAGPATPSNISATLNGTLAIDDAPGGFFGRRRRLSSCSAPDHQLVLTRQR
jgi:hypothetical protein